MNPLALQMIIGFAITFCLRQLEQFNTTTDWDKVKSDAEPRVRKLVPGTWLDDRCVAAMNTLIDQVKKVAANTAAFQAVLNHIANKNWKAAEAELKRLVLASIHEPATRDAAQHMAANDVIDALDGSVAA